MYGQRLGLADHMDVENSKNGEKGRGRGIGREVLTAIE